MKRLETAIKGSVLEAYTQTKRTDIYVVCALDEMSSGFNTARKASWLTKKVNAIGMCEWLQRLTNAAMQKPWVNKLSQLLKAQFWCLIFKTGFINITHSFASPYINLLHITQMERFHRKRHVKALVKFHHTTRTIFLQQKFNDCLQLSKIFGASWLDCWTYLQKTQRQSYWIGIIHK